MTIAERLGSFYLGKEYDLAGAKLSDVPVMYDARDLTTHAVCVGMTGSGKTGLCIDLLEEAALDKVPAIIIDPKGDITNLLLTFPDLLPENFLPWINADDARRKDMTPEAYAAKQAETWRTGLADWDQGPERIKSLRESVDFVIYTPGSDSGIPVSILSSFAAPQLNWDDEQEALRERISGTVSALLGLIGVEADPVRSREHILMATIFEHYWRNGEDLDLAKLILAIQNPPVRQLGVFDVDTFYPQKDRFELAMALNNIIAAPSFASWIQGAPLDVDHMLYGGDAKPNVSIFYIAHLNDAERMFFVTLLLEQMITWMRAQPGTTSLRALLYMDEVFGYFPPGREPASKRPMLTLMKQTARLRPWRDADHPKSGGPRLQGLDQRRHLVHRQAPGRSRQAAAAGWPGGPAHRGQRPARPPAIGQDHLRPGQPRVHVTQCQSATADHLPDSLGDELSARAADPQPGQRAHERQPFGAAGVTRKRRRRSGSRPGQPGVQLRQVQPRPWLHPAQLERSASWRPPCRRACPLSTCRPAARCTRLWAIWKASSERRSTHMTASCAMRPGCLARPP